MLLAPILSTFSFRKSRGKAMGTKQVEICARAGKFCSFLQRSLLEWSSSCTFSPSTPSPPSEAASFPPSLSRLFSFCIQSILYTKSKKRIFTYGDWGGGRAGTSYAMGGGGGGCLTFWYTDTEKKNCLDLHTLC